MAKSQSSMTVVRVMLDVVEIIRAFPPPLLPRQANFMGAPEDKKGRHGGPSDIANYLS
jgi:hypothetical protein